MEQAAVNAALNGTAAALLAAGLVAIKSGHRSAHAWLMRSAFAVSTVFLVGYAWLHWPEWVGRRAVDRPRVEGLARALWLVLLGSHTLLAVVNLPLVLSTLWLAHRERWRAHKRLARWTFPIWMYVSVTGVLVYFARYHWLAEPPLP